MGLISLGFLLGVAALQQFRELPPPATVWLLVVLAPLLVYRPRWRLPLAAACGFLWALWQAGLVLEHRLAPSLEGEDLIVTGAIASIPRIGPRISRFLFDVEQTALPGAGNVHGPRRVRLNWYGAQDGLKLGQRWQLRVRLKQPRGFSNPSGFDYESWLFQRGIQATGYVRGEASVLPGISGRYFVGRVRQELAEDINRALAGRENAGIAVALTVGERGGIAPDKWRLLVDTGTVHLLAISGLHIGLVAGFCYLLARRGLRFAPRLCLRWPAHKAASLVALGGGLGYAALAGFSVPTQRAVIMLGVLVGAVISARKASAVQVLAVALLAVLIWDPLSVLSSGFWLSFIAVAAIVYTVTSRPYPGLRWWRWWRWGRMQWVLALVLLPLTLLFFQRGALIAPLANLIAVPWVSLVVVPFTLLGSGLLGLVPMLGGALLLVADWAIDLLWWVLQALSEWPYASWRHRSPPLWSLIPMLIGALLLLAPRGWPARWVGLILLLPLAALSPSRPHDSEFRFHLLDVGQGLAAVVETRSHALVFDTGARYSARFDAGEAVLAPFLRDKGISVVDKLVISHGDNDHIGGADAVLRNFEVREILT
ncbi:MAG: DNA internalization-related competence protein ComEC/Rec2, partial [Gammaproteobacteria bacterium]